MIDQLFTDLPALVLNYYLSLCSSVPLFSAAGDGSGRWLSDVEKLAAEEPEEHEL